MTKKGRKKRILTIKECIDILESCYLANEHPYPMGLGLRQSVEYLKVLKAIYTAQVKKGVAYVNK